MLIRLRISTELLLANIKLICCVLWWFYWLEGDCNPLTSSAEATYLCLVRWLPRSLEEGEQAPRRDKYCHMYYEMENLRMQVCSIWKCTKGSVPVFAVCGVVSR